MKNSKKIPMELYIHIPFCVKKCEYCDFLSGPAGEAEKAAYTEALLRENYSGNGGQLSCRPDSVSCGNG